MIDKSVCNKIIELRKDRNLTQQQVADYLHIDRSNYSKYELGKLDINVDMIIELCKMYDVSADYLLSIKEY